MSTNSALAEELPRSPQHAASLGSLQVFSTCPSSSATPDGYLEKVIRTARWSERAGCTGRKIKNPQTDISRIVFGCVDDPSTIRRPGGRGIVGGSGRQLARSCCAQSYLPNRPLHGESDFFSIWRPGRIPGSGRGRRQIVIVHVIASRLGRRESGRNLTEAAWDGQHPQDHPRRNAVERHFIHGVLPIYQCASDSHRA